MKLFFSLERTVIKLASSIPLFSITTIIFGMDKRFLTGGTAYISLFRVIVRRKFEITFHFGAFFGSKFGQSLFFILTKKKRECS